MRIVRIDVFDKREPLLVKIRYEKAVPNGLMRAGRKADNAQ